jgi:AGCS family alanine or glycine:cation symporter
MWLVIGASVFTIYFAFVQFRFFGHAISLVKGDYSDPNDAGEVSHFPCDCAFGHGWPW